MMASSASWKVYRGLSSTITPTPAPTTTITPIHLAPQASGIFLGMGDYHTCVIQPGGNPLCWGWNTDDQLGNFASPDKNTFRFSQISAGLFHTCGLTTDGAVYCWGRNNPSSSIIPSLNHDPTPHLVSGLLDRVVQISAGAYHTCAVTEKGTLYCWGSNRSGKLGITGKSYSAYAEKVAGLPEQMIQVAAGLNHTCGLSVSEKIYCWGGDLFGQLGDGLTTDRANPQLLSNQKEPFTSLSAGWYHTCGLTATGGVMCWGKGYDGEIGNESVRLSLTPAPVVGLESNVKSISVGGNFTCALKVDSSVMCWGKNDHLQIGEDTPAEYTPKKIDGLPLNIKQLDTGAEDVCILTNGDDLWCWGANDLGQLTGNPGKDLPSPTLVRNLD